MSQTGNRFFRSAFISYVHYKENGEIAPIRVDGIGVGQYDANNGRIEAEDYFAASEISKVENTEGGFMVGDISDGDYLTFPNIHGLEGKSRIAFRVSEPQGATIEIHKDSPAGEIIASYKLKKREAKNSPVLYTFDFPPLDATISLNFVFRGKKDQLMNFDSFSFH
jgi:hypothetical protein